jgi:hypothetical protein
MTDQPPTDARSVRLIFEYDGEDVRLVSQVPVDVDIPRFAPSDQQVGHFVEIRTDTGASLARVPVRGAFQQSAEIFPEDHAEPITRVTTEARGAFTVVVPAHADAVQVALLRASSPAGDGDPGGGPGLAPSRTEDVELATFPLERLG